MSTGSATRRRSPHGLSWAAFVRALLAATVLAILLASVANLDGAGPLAAPRVAAQGSIPLDEPGVPVRIRVPSLGIDLPVVSSERDVPGNRRGYPLCDVAQYWRIYDLPGAPGTAWIYAHAQAGMFLPLLLNAQATDGNGLLGRLVTVQLRDGRLLRYRIDQVRQHALDRRIARRSRTGEQKLVLQTSEGPPGTVPKLHVAAHLTGVERTDERAPRARPRACWQPRTGTTDGRDGRPGASPSPATTAGSTGDEGPGTLGSAVSLALGGGAVLLGALIFAVYLVRRPPAPARRRS
jgi:hypothetical protein